MLTPVSKKLIGIAFIWPSISFIESYIWTFFAKYDLLHYYVLKVLFPINLVYLFLGILIAIAALRANRRISTDIYNIAGFNPNTFYW